MNKEFQYLLRVRYAECDSQKVVFNGKYVEYIDIAVTEFVRVTLGDYNELIEKGIDYQVVSVTVNWKAPAHFDEVLAISVQILKMGNTSFTLQIGFYNYDTKAIVATGEITYVLVDPKEHTKMIIPPDMRGVLEEGASGVVVNHAGVLSKDIQANEPQSGWAAQKLFFNDE